MAGQKLTLAQNEKYLYWRSQGVSTKEAAQRVGVSERTGKRWNAGWKGAGRNSLPSSVNARRTGTGYSHNRAPDPQDIMSLSDQAKRGLEDITVFGKTFFAIDLVPWQVKAAKVSVEAIADRSERHFGIANEPPGVGKSTLWTFIIPIWLLCGGGTMDPGWGRSLRFMLGHASKGVSAHYVQRIARTLDSTRPYYDKQNRVYAELALSQEFGRFRSLQALGDVSLWQDKQITVAQLEDVDLADKEPTFQAASPLSEFIGERCEYASWDDLVTEKTSRTVEGVDKLSDWFQKEAEQRIEPGGICWLVGQRIGPYDLFRDRLNDHWVDDDGTLRPKYFHIVFPAHHEGTCDGDHRQWDAEPDGEGCLLDAHRLSWRDILKVAQRPHFRTVFQQEDTDPRSVLVTQAMLDGGDAFETNPITDDVERVSYPGCHDHDRGWGEYPARADRLVNYVTIDPSVTGNWAIEWWATESLEAPRYLIWGVRKKMTASDLLDWDEDQGKFTGWMEKLQQASLVSNHLIRCWVLEANAAFKHLYQYRHFRRWRERWEFVDVIPHQTQKNKTDELMGVEALLRPKYRSGKARLPRRAGDIGALNFVRVLEKELTTYPHGATSDCVMADWFGETNMRAILRVGRRPLHSFEVESQLPDYLLRQRTEVATRRG